MSRATPLKEDMIERVARAIHSKRLLNRWFPEYSAPWDRLNEAHRSLFREEARAAIEAMREPTQAMCDAAFAHYGNDPHPFADEWRFMVNAALTSSSEGEAERLPPP